MGVTFAVVSCFSLPWEDMVGAGGLKYADCAICMREKPAVIFELEQVARQRQIFLFLPLFTKWPAYSNHPEVNFGIVRVAGVIPEYARDPWIGVEEAGHLFVQAVF